MSYHRDVGVLDDQVSDLAELLLHVVDPDVLDAVLRASRGGRHGDRSICERRPRTTRHINVARTQDDLKQTPIYLV